MRGLDIDCGCFGVSAGGGRAELLLAIGRDIVLAALFLLPETYAISTYPNTAILSDVLALVAFLQIVRGRGWFHVLPWLCIAPLFRIDIIIVYPVVFFLWRLQGCSWATSLKRSVAAGVAVLAFIVLTYWLLEANPLKVMAHADSINHSHIIMTFVYVSLFTFYNVINWFLIPLGAWCVAKRRQWVILALVLLPMLLIHYMYRYNGGAAKHYLYLIPFIAILTSQALAWLVKVARQHRWVAWTLVPALILYYTLSIRFDMPERPWHDDPTSYSQVGLHIPLFQEHASPYHARVGIGAGMGVATSDELMLLSGGVFYTDYIHRFKCHDSKYLSEAKAYLDHTPDKQFGMVFFNWSDMPLYPSLLLDEGYHYRTTKDRVAIWSMGNRVVKTYNKAVDHSEELMDKVIRHVQARRKPSDGPLYAHTMATSYKYMLDRMAQKGICRKVADGLYLCCDYHEDGDSLLMKPAQP